MVNLPTFNSDISKRYAALNIIPTAIMTAGILKIILRGVSLKLYARARAYNFRL